MYTCGNVLRLRETMHMVKLQVPFLCLVFRGRGKPEVTFNPEAAINRKWFLKPATSDGQFCRQAYCFWQKQ